MAAPTTHHAGGRWPLLYLLPVTGNTALPACHCAPPALPRYHAPACTTTHTCISPTPLPAPQLTHPRPTVLSLPSVVPRLPLPLPTPRQKHVFIHLLPQPHLPYGDDIQTLEQEMGDLSAPACHLHHGRHRIPYLRLIVDACDNYNTTTRLAAHTRIARLAFHLVGGG